MMGFLIMTASYLYALSVQLPDPDPIVGTEALDPIAMVPRALKVE
jgi:hypothetical protein